MPFILDLAPAFSGTFFLMSSQYPTVFVKATSLWQPSDFQSFEKGAVGVALVLFGPYIPHASYYVPQ